MENFFELIFFIFRHCQLQRKFSRLFSRELQRVLRIIVVVSVDVDVMIFIMVVVGPNFYLFTSRDLSKVSEKPAREVKMRDRSGKL